MRRSVNMNELQGQSAIGNAAGPRLEAFPSLTTSPSLTTWMVAIYLGAVILLEGTPWWTYNTYIAYIAAFLALFSIRKNPSLRLLEFWVIVAMILWWWLCATASPYPAESAIVAIYDMKIFAMSLIILLTIDSIPKVRLCLKAMIVAAVGLALYGIVFGYSVILAGEGRFEGMTSNPNFYGGFLADAFLAGIVLFPMSGLKWKFVILFYFGMAWFGLMGTGSRAPVVEIVIALVLYYFFELVHNRRTNRRQILLFPIILILIVAFILGFLPQSAFVQRVAAGFKEDSLIIRLNLFPYTLNLVSQRPVLGYGPGVFKNYSPSWVGSPHSSFLEILFSTGIPGLLFYIVLVLFLWNRLGKLVKSFRKDPMARKTFNAARAAFAGMVAYSFVSVSYHMKLSAAIFMILIVFTSRVSAAVNMENTETDMSRMDLSEESAEPEEKK